MTANPSYAAVGTIYGGATTIEADVSGGAGPFLSIIEVTLLTDYTLLFPLGLPRRPFRNGAWPMPAPNAPDLWQASGGSLGAATYYVKSTYTGNWEPTGESDPSPEASLACSADNLLQVASPPQSQNLAHGWNVYAATSSGAEELQNSEPIPIGTNWALPSGGLVAGTTPSAWPKIPAGTTLALFACEANALITAGAAELA